MRKDFKIGMALGLVLVAVVVVLLSTRPSLSVKARMLGPRSAVHHKRGAPPLSHDVELQKESDINRNPDKEGTKTERIHIVRAGETLSDISRQYYGSTDKWQKILSADRLPVKNPNTLRPGTRLIIPE
jgi:nucleoid-associated protein YgaU